MTTETIKEQMGRIVGDVRRLAEPGVLRLREICASSDAPRIDEAAGIIFDVKIVGLTSTNKGDRAADYPIACLTRAIPLYEGAVVHNGHPPIGKNPRLEDQVGVIRNVRAREDGLYGDLHYNPKHALASQLIWNAKKNPRAVMLSHDVEAKVVRQGGRQVVQEIVRVRSCDLVTAGGSTVSLFESAGDAPRRANPLRRFVEGPSTGTGLASIMRPAAPQPQEQSNWLKQLLTR
jgi:hypothetical protein